jgi:D-alanine--poly(phosphoribitol) ligase subunit 2
MAHHSVTVSSNSNQMTHADLVLDILAGVTETPEVRQNLDLRLYDLDILDSLRTVELIVAFSDRLGVEISPAELEREQWATPRLIVDFMAGRMPSGVSSS